MLAEHDVASVGPDLRARIHFGAIRLVSRVTSPFGHRGAGRLLGLLARVFGRHGYVVIVPAPGSRVKIGLYDAYWLSALMRDPAYEPETARMLDLVLDGHTAFVDCGANVGWWSAIAARRIGVHRRVIAIEASATVFARLKENSVLNGGSFVAIHAAVWDLSDIELHLATDIDRHAWSSIDPDIRATLRASGFREETVRSITIDDAVQRYVRDPVRRVVLKLDVEGVERQALHGAARVLAGDGVVIYEDHGRDASHAMSAELLSNGMHVFGWMGGGGPRLLADLSAIAAMKISSHHGYNFLACRPGTDSHRLVSSACERSR